MKKINLRFTQSGDMNTISLFKNELKEVYDFHIRNHECKKYINSLSAKTPNIWRFKKKHMQ